MVSRTSAATGSQWLSRKSGAGHRGLSAGSQRHFGRGDGQDVARLPAGVVFGAHIVAPHHGGLVRKDGRSQSRRRRRGRRHHLGAGVRGRPARVDHRELPRKTRGIVGQDMGGVPVMGLSTQTGVRPRKDDRHLRSSQIWPGQIGETGRTLVRKNPKLRMGQRRIHISESVKYLGVIIDRGLLWIEHTRYVADKVMAAARKVRGVAGKTWGTDPRTLREIYNGAIRPILLYGTRAVGARGLRTPESRDTCGRPRGRFSWGSRGRTGRRQLEHLLRKEFDKDTLFPYLERSLDLTCSMSVISAKVFIFTDD
jgi:hypothetical protein